MLKPLLPACVFSMGALLGHRVWIFMAHCTWIAPPPNVRLILLSIRNLWQSRIYSGNKRHVVNESVDLPENNRKNMYPTARPADQNVYRQTARTGEGQKAVYGRKRAELPSWYLCTMSGPFDPSRRETNDKGQFHDWVTGLGTMPMGLSVSLNGTKSTHSEQAPRGGADDGAARQKKSPGLTTTPGEAQPG